MGLASALARMVQPLTKANPAGEGNYHAGPYTVSGGVLPYSSAPWNFWQADMDIQSMPSCSIVEACIWAYIRAIAQLPGYHRRDRDDGGVETVTTSALSRLLRTPSSYQTSSDFLVHLIRSLLLNGNSYWLAQRNSRNEVEALHWTDPRQCRVREVPISGQAFAEIFYEISTNPLLETNVFGTRGLVVPARDVLHIKLATPRHPLIGETWLSALAYELGTRAGINQGAASFAANMSRPSGILTTDMNLSAAQVGQLREAWKAQSSGMNAGGVPLLTMGVKFQPMSVSNEDAQIVEQLKLNDRTIAAVFGVPGIILGITEGGTARSAEAVMTEWLASGLGWLLNHIEVAIDSFIGLNAVTAWREFTEYDTRALLRSLFAERMDGLTKGVLGGVLAPNEARRLEGYPDAEDGDEPRLQTQVVPLSAWSQTMPPQPTADVPPVPDPPESAPPPPEPDSPEKGIDIGNKLALRIRQHADFRRAA
jgi:HK97 family phage portal protein